MSLDPKSSDFFKHTQSRINTALFEKSMIELTNEVNDAIESFKKSSIGSERAKKSMAKRRLAKMVKDRQQSVNSLPYTKVDPLKVSADWSNPVLVKLNKKLEDAINESQKKVVFQIANDLPVGQAGDFLAYHFAKYPEYGAKYMSDHLGRIPRINLSNREVSSELIDILPELKNLVALNLSNTKLARQIDFKKLNRLGALNMSGASVYCDKTLNINSIGFMNELRYLDLSRTNLKHFPNGFRDLHNLKTFVLFQALGDTKIKLDILADMEQLSHFYIDHTIKENRIHTDREIDYGYTQRIVHCDPTKNNSFGVSETDITNAIQQYINRPNPNRKRQVVFKDFAVTSQAHKVSHQMFDVIFKRIS